MGVSFDEFIRGDEQVWATVIEMSGTLYGGGKVNERTISRLLVEYESSQERGGSVGREWDFDNSSD